jgi:hypothetical protein
LTPIGCSGLGGLMAAIGFTWFARNPVLLPGWFMLTKARRLVRDRPDRVVDPDEPDVLFVEVVPRENWKKLKLETATDVGFLTVDEQRRQVRFEGDQERLIIPYASIRSCEVEWIYIGGEGGIKYYFTVLEFQTKKGMCEYPFAYRNDMGNLGASVREQRAMALRDRISAL